MTLPLRVPKHPWAGCTAHVDVDDEEAAQPETNVNPKCSGRIAVWLHSSRRNDGHCVIDVHYSLFVETTCRLLCSIIIESRVLMSSLIE